MLKLKKTATRSRSFYQKKLGNERFVANAPAEVVDEERGKQTAWEQKLVAAKERLVTIENA